MHSLVAALHCAGGSRPCMRTAVLSTALCCAGHRAVGLGNSGCVYFGVNIEFPGVPLNQSVRDGRTCSLTDLRAPSVNGARLSARHGSACQQVRP